MATKPVPAGYHTLTPYIIVKGCAAAIDYYKKVFGAEERMRMPGPDGTIGHCELQIGDSVLMLADEHPSVGALAPKGRSPVALHLYVKDVDKTFDAAVKAGAKVDRPLADQFYGDRMGVIVDPYGHTWSIATHVKDVSPAEMDAGAREASKKMPT